MDTKYKIETLLASALACTVCYAVPPTQTQNLQVDVAASTSISIQDVNLTLTAPSTLTAGQWYSVNPTASTTILVTSNTSTAKKIDVQLIDADNTLGLSNLALQLAPGNPSFSNPGKAPPSGTVIGVASVFNLANGSPIDAYSNVYSTAFSAPVTYALVLTGAVGVADSGIANLPITVKYTIKDA